MSDAGTLSEHGSASVDVSIRPLPERSSLVEVQASKTGQYQGGTTGDGQRNYSLGRFVFK